MRDDSDGRAVFDPPDANTVYARYLVKCRRLGVEPMTRQRAAQLVAEWNRVIRASSCTDRR